MASKKRKADKFAGAGSIAGKLKERRERIESGDLTAQPTPEQRKEDKSITPVDAANERAQARIERLRKKFKSK